MIKALKIILIGLMSIVVLFVILVTRLFAIKIVDIQIHQRQLNHLEDMYDDDYQPIDETAFVSFDLNDETIKLNDIQMIASHNSYKKNGSDLGRFFVGLGDSFEEARALDYGYKTLTDQLESGIRSMEFDVRLRKTQFMLTHVPLVDNSSVAPVLEDAFKEIKMYSDHNPNHVPIIILMEIKDDWMILDHALQTIDSDALERLNVLIETSFGETLFMPSDMMEDGKTLSETIATTGWPSVKSLLGKVIFVLHPGNFTQMYYELDTTLETLPMFIGNNHDGLGTSYDSFVVYNTPDIDIIQSMVDQNLIVRTRADDMLELDIDRFQDAIESGAQILTTDFSVGRKDLDSDDMIYLDQQAMIVKKEQP